MLTLPSLPRSLLTPCWQQALDKKGAGNSLKNMTMTMLTNIATSTAIAFSSEVGTGSRQENASDQKSGAPFRFNRNGEGSSPFALRTAVWLARLRRFINRFLAAVIARHERHATREALRMLDDRQLRDIAMCHQQTDFRLEELAQTRARMQQPGWH